MTRHSLILGIATLFLAAPLAAVAQEISPEQMRRMGEEAERNYRGPPMPRIASATFSGDACPGDASRMSYNWLGKWRWDDADAQFLLPRVAVAARGGETVRGDCRVELRVEDLAQGWQVAPGNFLLRAGVAISPDSKIEFWGASGWDQRKPVVS